MGEISRTWDALYKDIRAILDKARSESFQSFPILHALREELSFFLSLFQDLQKATA